LKTISGDAVFAGSAVNGADGLAAGASGRGDAAVGSNERLETPTALPEDEKPSPKNPIEKIPKKQKNTLSKSRMAFSFQE
jgi:hypothetical protein